MRSYMCPQCKKLRMTRELDYVVSLEKQKYKTKSGEDVELFVDICDKCKHRNYTKYFEPSRSDIRRVLNTMKTEAELGDKDSLEDLL